MMNNKINKKMIVDQLQDILKQEIKKTQEACDQVRSMVAEEDMKAESKWDMRRQEANYLASGHAKRLEELLQEQELLDAIPVRNFASDEEVGIGSLVTLECNDQERFYFIAPTSGGTMLSVDGAAVLVISVFSPIGSEVLSLKVGDTFELETPREVREYLIKSIQ